MKIILLISILTAQSVSGPETFQNGDKAVLMESTQLYTLYSPTWKVIAKGLTLAQLQAKAGIK